MAESNHQEITDCDGVRKAVEDYKNEPTDTKWERYVIDRAVSLGCTEHIPDEWGIE